MKRPICKLAIGAIIGIIGGLYWKNQAVLLSIFLIVLILCVSKVKFSQKFILNSLIFSRKSWISVTFILIISIIFNGYMQYTEKRYSSEDERLKGLTNWKAIVVSNKVEKEYKDHYVVQLDNGMKCNVYISSQKADIAFGDEVIVYGEYKELEKQKNPGGYDANLTGKTKKIVGTILAEKIEHVQSKKINAVAYIIFQVRQYCLNRIEKNLPKEASYITQALILGEKSKIPKEVMEDFRESNLSHMLAISGAHISYILIAIMFFEKFCAKRTLQIFILIFLTFFCILVGATPSVMRACIMSGIFIVGMLVHRKCCIYTNMAISIVVLCIENPYCLWDLGLQLSYVGTLGILIWMPVFQTYPHMWINCGRQTSVYQKGCKLCNTNT